jgi:hypothetical protein
VAAGWQQIKDTIYSPDTDDFEQALERAHYVRLASLGEAVRLTLYLSSDGTAGREYFANLEPGDSGEGFYISDLPSMMNDSAGPCTISLLKQ